MGANKATLLENCDGLLFVVHHTVNISICYGGGKLQIFSRKPKCLQTYICDLKAVLHTALFFLPEGPYSLLNGIKNPSHVSFNPVF